VGGDSLAAADCVHAFIRLSLQADLFRLNFERLRESGLHGSKVRPQLGLFGDHDGVNVADALLAILQYLGDLVEKNEAGDALPLRIGVREKRADIAGASRTED